MRAFLLTILLASGSLLGQVALGQVTPEKKPIVDTVQKLFDAMKAKDALAIQAVMTPGASVVAMRATGQVVVTPVEKFAESIGKATGELVERMWDPTVQIEGKIATLWAPYDFHRDGKLTHCGIDAVTLVKVPEGWKITNISYTTITEGCVSPK